MPFSPHDKLGSYEVIGQIGAGGMGEVYRARDLRLGRTVAIKVLPETVAADLGRRSRFEAEARAASALNHPGIVTVFDIGMEDGRAYLVTEFIDGETLRHSRPESLRRQLDVAAQVADALAAAHAAGITHRDLKPENIMVTHEGRAKILDFGLARQATNSPDDATLSGAVTTPGTLLGTVGYMSPEQARGRTADHRSDIFSFGAVLYELLSGWRAFDGESAADALSAILKTDPPELPPSVPVTVRQIVERCLEKNPGRRFQSASDLGFALRALSGTSSAMDIAALEAPAGRRISWALVTISSIVALALIGFWRLATEPQRPDISRYRFTPFATEDYDEELPVWSPDGKSIAYVRRPGAEYELVVKLADGSEPVVLTRNSQRITNVSWAPDGSRLYYVDSPTIGRIFSVARAGGTPKQVAGGQAYAAALSPDGKTLATLAVQESSEGRRKVLMLSSPPGATGRSFATLSAGTPNAMAWSPDGNKVLLNRGGAEIALFDRRAGTLRSMLTRAVTGLSVTVSPAWMPDNRNVLINWPQPESVDRMDLTILDTDTQRPTTVLTGSEGFATPAISSTGRIAYVAGPLDYDLVELPLDGSPVRRLIATRQWEHSAAWSPVEPELAYIRQNEIRIQRRGSNNTARLDRTIVTAAQFSSQVSFQSLAFSPDGTRIAYTVSSKESPGKVWISPVGGGAPALLTDFDGYASALSWSADGHWVAFNFGPRGSFGSQSLMKMRVGSGEKPIELAKSFCDFAPSWSPDGQRILCSARGALYTIAAEGGEPEFLDTKYEPVAVWSPDDRYIYAIRDADGKRQLGRLDWKGGAFQPIVDVPLEWVIRDRSLYMVRLSLAPDGKSLATTIQKPSGDIWILDGFQPASTLLQRLLR